MKVKDLNALLATYNQDADVRVIVHNREYDFSLTTGGAEGVTKGTMRDVGLYVDSLCGHENANVPAHPQAVASNMQQIVDNSAESTARVKWNFDADAFNQWDSLGQDEKDELIANAAGEVRRNAITSTGLLACSCGKSPGLFVDREHDERHFECHGEHECSVHAPSRNTELEARAAWNEMITNDRGDSLPPRKESNG